MTQMMLESLTHEEYCHLLSYGDPMTQEEVNVFSSYDIDTNIHSRTDGDSSAWISTLESTTYPDLTFGYIDEL